MEPTQRKMKILEAVVEEYIKSGEPVGSKALCDVLDFSVSSATVRNDMAELSSLGLLEQTHTSSGRVPTKLGYRIYVDKLMKPSELDQREKTALSDTLYMSANTPENLLEKTADVLSRITGCATVAASPSGERAVIRRVRFVQTGGYTAMVVLITSTGSVKTRLFRCDFLITSQFIEMFEKLMNEKLEGLSVTSITPAFMQTTAVSLGEMSMIVPNMLVAVHDAAKDAASTGVFIKGQANLFTIPELASSDGKKVMEMLGHSSELARLLSSESEKADVLIGSELHDPAFTNLSFIVKHYKASDECSGTLAVVGPVRMDYPKIIATLEYAADTVGTLLNEMLEF